VALLKLTKNNHLLMQGAWTAYKLTLVGTPAKPYLLATWTTLTEDIKNFCYKPPKRTNYDQWAVDFETPVFKLYLLLISADAASEREKKRKKCCCPLVFQSVQPIQCFQLLSFVKLSMTSIWFWPNIGPHLRK
jgi:hypothetical protein